MAQRNLVVITPCIRPKLLPRIRASIPLDVIRRWYIIYDTSKGRTYENQFDDVDWIVEMRQSSTGKCGHDLRNYVLDAVERDYVEEDSFFIYYVDDDNIIHPRLNEFLRSRHARTSQSFFFPQWRKSKTILMGNVFKLGCIDTAQMLVSSSMVRGLRWDANNYGADGIYAIDIKQKYPRRSVFIPKVMAYYNFLTDLEPEISADEASASCKGTPEPLTGSPQ